MKQLGISIAALFLYISIPLHAQEQQFWCLKGYYRVYQATNSMLSYFVDGMVEMYAPFSNPPSSQAQADDRARNRSVFIGRKFFGERRRKAPQANGDDTFVRMNMPNLESVTLIESIKSDVYSTRNNGDVYRWADKCGRIYTQKQKVDGQLVGTTTVEIDNLMGQNKHQIDMSQLKMYGIVARMTRFDESETYLTSNTAYTLDKILSSSKHQTYLAHYRGEDEDERIDVYSEFFVTEKTVISEKEMRRIKKKKNHDWTFSIPKSVPELESSVKKAWGKMVEY